MTHSGRIPSAPWASVFHLQNGRGHAAALAEDRVPCRRAAQGAGLVATLLGLHLSYLFSRALAPERALPACP